MPIKYRFGSARGLMTMVHHSSSKKILITSNSPILLRILKLNLDIYKWGNGDRVVLIEYSPGSQINKDLWVKHWVKHNSIDLIVAVLSSSVPGFDPLISQISMISEAWKIRLLVISDDWPSELALNPLSMRLKAPFDFDELYSKIGNALQEVPVGNIA